MNNHEAIRNNIKAGDILLSRNKKAPISKIISGVTRSYWSHAFLYIGEGKILESSIGGVAIHPLEKYLNNIYDVGLFRINKDLLEEEIFALIKNARKFAGISYGYLQLAWFLILRLFGKSEDPDWSIDVDEGMVCSELVANAYETIGIKFKDLPPHQIEPADLDESKMTIRII